MKFLFPPGTGGDRVTPVGVGPGQSGTVIVVQVDGRPVASTVHLVHERPANAIYAVCMYDGHRLAGAYKSPVVLPDSKVPDLDVLAS